MTTWLTNPAHARWLEAETDALLDFARASHTPTGFGRLDADGVLEPGIPDELWITCRMTHVFSLGALMGRPGCAPLVDHGLASLQNHFEDAEYGGWYSAITADGPANDIKEAYAHAFVLLAASSALAAKRPGARELLDRALRVSEQRFWDEEQGMVVESWDRTFTECEEYRGVNATMHTVEAYLAVADVTGEEIWRERALRVTRRVVDVFARENEWRIPEHFDTDWRPLLDYNADEPAHPFRPFGATIGHWMEWARLTVQLAAALKDSGREVEEWMEPAACALFEAGVREGWAVDGADGFVYTIDFAGEPVVHERMHWVVCEALATAAVLHRLTGRAEYTDWYERWWDYVAQYLLERPGAWTHELDASNEPSGRTWPGKPDAYHAVQTTLMPRLPLAPSFAAALAAGKLDG